MLCDDVKASLLAPDGPLPAELDRHAAGCPTCATVRAVLTRLESTLCLSVLVEPPARLQASLAALAVTPSFWQRLVTLLRRQWTRPWVLGAELASFAVLVYALVQLFAWIASSTSLVLGDVPYAIELLVLSPAVDYASQLQGVLQQLGLWAIVAAVGWLLAQSIGPLQRQQTPA